MNAYPSDYFGGKPANRSSRPANLGNLAPFKHYLIAFIQSLPHGACVLDLGCGSGKTIRLVQTLRPDVHIEGCDFNDVEAFLPEDVPFVQCSAEEAGARYGENTFDAVICQHVIEHLGSPLGLMHSVRTLLKPSGKLFLETPNWVRLFTPWAHFFFWNDYTHVRLYPKFALVKLLVEHDFAIENVWQRTTSQWFPRQGTLREEREEAPRSKVAVPARQSPYHLNSYAARLFARAVNPFFRDVLLLVARCEK